MNLTVRTKCFSPKATKYSENWTWATIKLLNTVKVTVHNKRTTTRLVKYHKKKKINKWKYHKNK